MRSPLRMDDVTGIARAHLMRQSLGIAGGQLIANPIPRHAEIPIEEIEPFIAQALEAALEQEISAKEVTPFLLSRLFDLTQGRSLQANKALVLNNAALGAKIAGAICAQK